MTAQSTRTATKPTHRIYRVIGEGKKANWTAIGAAWPNRDGQGFSITCDAVPLSGRIIMRAITGRESAARAPAGGHRLGGRQPWADRSFPCHPLGKY